MTQQRRYPAVPLVVHDPFFSVWSFSDRLTESWSCHWGGADSRLSGILRIDGRSLRFAGPDGGEAMEQTGCEMYINPRDEGYEPGMSGMKFKMPEGGKYYDDGDVVKAAGLEFKVLATPGHTPGGVCLICGNALFTGDTLFRGSCGRTDLPGGNMRMEMASLKRICALPGDYEVYPGHMDSSTLERERRFNHYCREAMTKF